jgi:hypothetical protein
VLPRPGFRVFEFVAALTLLVGWSRAAPWPARHSPCRAGHLRLLAKASSGKGNQVADGTPGRIRTGPFDANCRHGRVLARNAQFFGCQRQLNMAFTRGGCCTWLCCTGRSCRTRLGLNRCLDIVEVYRVQSVRFCRSIWMST